MLGLPASSPNIRQAVTDARLPCMTASIQALLWACAYLSRTSDSTVCGLSKSATRSVHGTLSCTTAGVLASGGSNLMSGTRPGAVTWWKGASTHTQARQATPRLHCCIRGRPGPHESCVSAHCRCPLCRFMAKSCLCGAVLQGVRRAEYIADYVHGYAMQCKHTLPHLPPGRVLPREAAGHETLTLLVRGAHSCRQAAGQEVLMVCVYCLHDAVQSSLK
jgi:hypothetical protein